eukprot:466374_1
MTIINVLLLMYYVSSKSLNRMLLLSSDSGGTHSDDSKAAPATITTAPTITTLDPTIITSDPTIITSDPTVITSAPTIITSTPTIITSPPTYYPTIITSAPTICLITAELNCAELTCTDITFSPWNSPPLETQNQCENSFDTFEATLNAAETRKYCFTAIKNADLTINQIRIENAQQSIITGLIVGGNIFTLTDWSDQYNKAIGLPIDVELCLTNESKEQANVRIMCVYAT